jgi:hypothetical protein
VHGKLPEAMQKLFNVGKPIFLLRIEFSSASKKINGTQLVQLPLALFEYVSRVMNNGLAEDRI